MKAILQSQLSCPFRTYFQLFIAFHRKVFKSLSLSILSFQKTIQTYISGIRIFSAFYKLSSTRKKGIYSHALITEKQLKCHAFSGFTLKNCICFIHEWRAYIQKKIQLVQKKLARAEQLAVSRERQLSLARVWGAIYFGRNLKKKKITLHFLGWLWLRFYLFL